MHVLMRPLFTMYATVPPVNPITRVRPTVLKNVRRSPAPSEAVISLILYYTLLDPRFPALARENPQFLVTTVPEPAVNR